VGAAAAAAEEFKSSPTRDQRRVGLLFVRSGCTPTVICSLSPFD